METRAFEPGAEVVADRLHAAVDAGELRPDIDIDAVAEMLTPLQSL